MKYAYRRIHTTLKTGYDELCHEMNMMLLSQDMTSDKVDKTSCIAEAGLAECYTYSYEDFDGDQTLMIDKQYWWAD